MPCSAAPKVAPIKVCIMPLAAVSPRRLSIAFISLYRAAWLIGALGFAVSSSLVANAQAPTSSGAEPREDLPQLPPLETILEKAKERAPEVRMGQASIELGRAEMIGARVAPLRNPHFEVLAERRPDGATTNGIPWNATVWVPLELGGERRQRIGEASAFMELQELSLAQARAQAIGMAYALYGVTIVAAERVRVLERLVQVSREASEIFEARVEVGDAVLRDSTMARVDLARNQALLREAKGRLNLAFAELERITGERYGSASARELSPPPIDFDAYYEGLRREPPPAVQVARAKARYYERQRDRLKREMINPFQLMFMGGQGDLGEARIGAGLAYELPMVQRNQGPRARAEAERLRAGIESEVKQNYIQARIDGIVRQFIEDGEAYQVLTDFALPAADQAIEAATETARGGKEDAFVILFSRRERVMLSLQRLEIAERQWTLLGELIQLTGELP